MSQNYTRRDYRLDISAVDCSARLRLSHPDGSVVEAHIAREALDAAAAGQPADLEAALRQHAVTERVDGHGPEPFSMSRVCLQVAEPAWSRIDWELLAETDRACLVRSCPVRPRIEQIPLTFPLRMLQAGGAPTLHEALDSVFGTSQRALAVQDAHVASDTVQAHPLAAGWPTVDVLHLNGAEPDAALRGWLPRFLDHYQTRLLVLELASPARRADALQLAQYLLERAGPAVIVAAPGDALWLSSRLYADLVHDRPLDWIRSELGRVAYFGGAGREDLLRYSPLAPALASNAVVHGLARRAAKAAFKSPRLVRGFGAERTARIVQEAVRQAIQSASIPLQASQADAAGAQLDFRWADPARQARFKSMVAVGIGERGLLSPGMDSTIDAMVRLNPGFVDVTQLGLEVSRTAVPIRSLGPRVAGSSIAERLRSVGTLASQLRYEDHESDGMLPLAARVAETRTLWRKVQGRTEPSRRAARHVNARFLTERGESKLKPLAPAHTRLRPGSIVHLGVQVGPRDRELVQVGSTALLEEIDRRPEGTWIEIGVTAYDFELLGAPVQALWLPAVGASTLACFSLRVPASTPLSGVARVRFSLFHEDTVVQSFLVVARLASGARAAVEHMAQALGVTRRRLQRLGDPGYVTRLEFHACGLADVPKVAPRALSLIANDNAGDKVYTLKGGELFRVARQIDPKQVQAVRDALARASSDGRQQYRYSFRGVPNSGDPDGLLEVMWELAREGWTLFSMLVPDEAGQQAVRERLDSGMGLRAAHIDITSVIPWARSTTDRCNAAMRWTIPWTKARRP